MLFAPTHRQVLRLVEVWVGFFCFLQNNICIFAKNLLKITILTICFGVFCEKIGNGGGFGAGGFGGVGGLP